jgi:flagellar hook-associated protein 1 FlgK
MNAAQTGLYVTGHNMANVDTTGYTRQQALQQDFYSQNISYGATGVNQVGLGVDIAAIRQIRDKFYDISYRDQVGKLNFYDVKAKAGLEIETIIGELQSQYRTDSVFKDMFSSLQELSFDPQSLATRENFISTAIMFVNKVGNVYDRMVEYQHNLDLQVRQTVMRINQLTNDIEKYNRLIMDAEASGDNANDFRDCRNNDLDELAALIKIEYKEQLNKRVDVTAEGHELIVNGSVNKMGLKYIDPNYSFVEPVFTNSNDILPSDASNVLTVFNYAKPINPATKNDSGQLKGLMVARGMKPLNYSSQEPSDPRFDATGALAIPQPTPLELNDYYRDLFNWNCVIPRALQEFDVIVNKVVTMINDCVAPYREVTPATAPPTYEKDPDGPYNLYYENTTLTEIFVRKNGYYDAAGTYHEPDRWDAATNLYNEPDPDYYYSLYTAGNIAVNPALLADGGYNLISLMTPEVPGDPDSAPQGVSDNSVILQKLLEQWKSGIISISPEGRLSADTAISGEKLNIDSSYKYFISNESIQTNESLNFLDEQSTLAVQTDNKRKTISAVSLDEEMKAMMIYQRSFNASARLVNTIDSMIDKIVNGTGRVGL